MFQLSQTCSILVYEIDYTLNSLNNKLSLVQIENFSIKPYIMAKVLFCKITNDFSNKKHESVFYSILTVL